MAVTINNFISALHNPSDSFRTLSDAYPQLSPQGGIEVNRSTHMASCHICYNNKNFILSLPLSPESLTMAQRASVRLKQMRSQLLMEYKVLPSELNMVDSLGRAVCSDLILQEIPAGRVLSSCIEEVDAARVVSSIYRLESELQRLKLALFNISADNIILTDSYDLYPIHLHYAELAEDCACQTTALQEFITASLGVEFKGVTSGSSPLDTAQNALYGYMRIGNPFEGMCVAESNNGVGYIATDGTEIIPPKFIWAGDMREGRAEVETAEGMGLIDAQGKYIIEPRYQIVEFDPRTGLSRVKENEKWATYDYEGCPIG